MMNNFWYPGLKTRTYFTLEEVAEITNPDGDWGFWELESFADEKIGVYKFINHPSWENKDNIYTKTLFSDYIWPQFWKSVVIYVDGEPAGDNWAYEDINEAWLRKAGLICRWINESKEVYEVLISNLEANKSKLLDQIKSITGSNSTTANTNSSTGNTSNETTTNVNSRTNDTPQQPGSWEEDDYVSVISGTATNNQSSTNSTSSSSSDSNYQGETTVATDPGTMMSRLKEIQDDLTSLYGKWANEFRRFIIHSAI